MMNASVARWLWPKSAKWVTNKPARFC